MLLRPTLPNPSFDPKDGTQYWDGMYRETLIYREIPKLKVLVRDIKELPTKISVQRPHRGFWPKGGEGWL